MDGKDSTAHNILEHMLLDECANPKRLPLSLLEAITNNFSNKREIGRGGFAVVYKGMLGNGTVAVKKLSTTLDMHEKKFSEEVRCLLKVRHKNIVRFLGYCADTQGEMIGYEGKVIMADVRNRLLCFEFVPNGSLHDYITDASCGLEWRVRYEMIRGICEGLQYLHENHIVHLDLKPSNILLDDKMVPKIADFGLSRCFDANQSRDIASKLIGSIGYLAPEFYDRQITFNLDIYSLGVIVIELLTGRKGYSTVEKIVENWRNRLEISLQDTPLQQVQACAEIGIMCIDPNPENRPIIQHIIKRFMELGSTEEFVQAGESSSAAQVLTLEVPVSIPVGSSATSSVSTTNAGYASSTTTEAMFIISPNGKFQQKIKSWTRGCLLGSGSFGMVYEAISDEGMFFAAKEVSLLDQGSIAKDYILGLEQEIALLSQFEHENIVKYYGSDKDESKLYIFIELVTQGSLSSIYQKYKLRDSQVSVYTRQILNGLIYLHERDVVHRDIKCANILVHANGSVKLADFGLAEISKNYMLRESKGSVYWMAPEVINPKKMYGPSADIWSLGCTVLEMLTRLKPFPNVEWIEVFFMIGRGEQPPIPNYLSKEAQDFIGQCVRVDPENRPSASQLLEHPFVNRPLRASFESSPPGLPS
ncbi:hypothetical protein PAHAL_9G122800 [Panicum hallii]|uniref:Protein kinase domain-containing protein n=1 Tax=Panicum hallii TaxID=206008 RepID=A0A2S3IJ00_9POAL|nr:tyrosine-protein kinase Blk-like [Panicum hallii]XP_025792714.1 tyrosine-protein kinase Blk-like [Panicum hallii]PAN45489.1 hypothetical protein PAHAL_9G122800 [Panicum hallii]PVH31351.1 hypothetical protein PAHAL_9G122800 [Panicum hallii]